jgi:hypothetical protein
VVDVGVEGVEQLLVERAPRSARQKSKAARIDAGLEAGQLGVEAVEEVVLITGCDQLGSLPESHQRVVVVRVERHYSSRDAFEAHLAHGRHGYRVGSFPRGRASHGAKHRAIARGRQPDHGERRGAAEQRYENRHPCLSGFHGRRPPGRVISGPPK